MFTRKTKKKNRVTYTYQDSHGKKEILVTDKDGVTEEWIHLLHRQDDNEVYNNLKNLKPKLTAEEKLAKAKWESEHPNEEFPKNWLLSLDFSDTDNGNVQDKLISGATPIFDNAPSDEVQLLRDFVETLSPSYQKLYRLKYIEEYSQSEIALVFGVSNAAISKQIKKLKELIEKNFKTFSSQG